MNQNITARVEHINRRLSETNAPFMLKPATSYKANRGLCDCCVLTSRKRETVFANPVVYWSPELERMSDMELISCLSDIYKRSIPFNAKEIPVISSKEEIMASVLPKVLSAVKNVAALEAQEIPYIQVPDTDLCAVFYLPLRQQEGTIAVDKNLAAANRLSVTELLMASSRNVLKQMTVGSLPSVLSGMLGEGGISDSLYEEDLPLYVVATGGGTFGAGVLAGGKQVLAEIGRRICAEKFYILPSSIYEVLCLPDRGDRNVAQLTEIVSEVNASVVAPEDVLSDSVYHFDLQTGVLRMFTVNE